MIVLGDSITLELPITSYTDISGSAWRIYTFLESGTFTTDVLSKCDIFVLGAGGSGGGGAGAAGVSGAYPSHGGVGLQNNIDNNNYCKYIKTNI